MAKPRLFRHDLHRNVAGADLAGERVVAAVAALGGVAERQQEAFVAAHQLLQARRARAGVNRRVAGDVVRRAAVVLLFARQLLATQQIEHVAAVVRQRFVGLRRTRRFAFRQQREVQQPVGVVVGRPQHLPAGQVLVNRRDAPLQPHVFAGQWLADRQARQGGAIGAQQENRLHQIAAGLFDGQRRQLAIVDAAFGHHPIHRQPQLLFDLFRADRRQRLVAAPQLFLQLMGGLNGFFAPFYRYVHQHTSTRVVRGIASRRSPQVSKISSPSEKRCGRLTR